MSTCDPHIAEKINDIYESIIRELYEAKVSRQCSLLVAVLATEIAKRYTNAKLIVGLAVIYDSAAWSHCWSENDITGSVDLMLTVDAHIQKSMGRNRYPIINKARQLEDIPHCEIIGLDTTYKSNLEYSNIYLQHGIKEMWKAMMGDRDHSTEAEEFFGDLYRRYGLAV